MLHRELLRAHERALSLAEARRTPGGARARAGRTHSRVEHRQEEDGVRVDERGARLDSAQTDVRLLEAFDRAVEEALETRTALDGSALDLSLDHSLDHCPPLAGYEVHVDTGHTALGIRGM